MLTLGVRLLYILLLYTIHIILLYYYIILLYYILYIILLYYYILYYTLLFFRSILPYSFSSPPNPLFLLFLISSSLLLFFSSHPSPLLNIPFHPHLFFSPQSCIPLPHSFYTCRDLQILIYTILPFIYHLFLKYSHPACFICVG